MSKIEIMKPSRYWDLHQLRDNVILYRFSSKEIFVA